MACWGPPRRHSQQPMQCVRPTPWGYILLSLFLSFLSLRNVFFLFLAHFLGISRFLVRVNVPYDIVWQSIDTVARSQCHFGKAFGFGLVLKGVAGKVDSRPVHICFYDDVDSTNAVERHLLVLVGAPVAEFGHVTAVGRVLLVA